MQAATVVINRRALRHNLQRLRELAPASKLVAVVKANAYGHGLIETARTLPDADAFGVARLEEALRLRDKGVATEVVVATIAPADAQAHLRNGLAMGANRAIHVITDQAIQPLTAARTLLKLIEKEQPDLVILGKQAIDDDANQTGQMLATLWGRPQATFASKLDIADGKATVTREVDAGLETLEVDLPAVVTTDLRLNEPRFIKLPDIMKAKSKPLETLQLADLGVEAADTLKTTHYAAPGRRRRMGTSGVAAGSGSGSSGASPNWRLSRMRRRSSSESGTRARKRQAGSLATSTMPARSVTSTGWFSGRQPSSTRSNSVFTTITPSARGPASPGEGGASIRRAR